MAEFENFTSLPAAEEQTFVVYEQHGRAATKSSMSIALVVSGIVFALALAMYFGIPPKHTPSQDYEESLLQTAPAEAPTATP